MMPVSVVQDGRLSLEYGTYSNLRIFINKKGGPTCGLFFFLSWLFKSKKAINGEKFYEFLGLTPDLIIEKKLLNTGTIGH